MAMALHQGLTAPGGLKPKYKRTPVPLHFPEYELMPETGVHVELKQAVYDVLRDEFQGHATIACDQFLYWDPTNPKRCLAPDVMIRPGGPDELVRTWKVWERGAPLVAVEVISRGDARDDAGDEAWEKKLDGYRHTGIAEIVRFDCEDAVHPLRVWDHVNGDLVERELSGGRVAASHLGLYWVVVPHAACGLMLRLARDAEGQQLLLTPRERAEAERERAEAALRRVAELEALLKERG